MQCFNDKYHTRYPVYPNAYLDYCCLEFGQYSIQNASNSSNNNNTNNSDTNYTVQRRYIAFSKRSSSEMKKYSERLKQAPCRLFQLHHSAVSVGSSDMKS